MAKEENASMTMNNQLPFTGEQLQNDLDTVYKTSSSEFINRWQIHRWLKNNYGGSI
jgi:hypothetical protein